MLHLQNFYAKTATLVLDSRIKVKPARGANGARKPNKWVCLLAAIPGRVVDH